MRNRPTSGASARRPIVLVVDDDDDSREIVVEALEQNAYDVRVARGGQEALTMLFAGSVPDVIVLDLMMPVVSGYDVLAALQEHARLATVPVVVVSATHAIRPGDLGVRRFLRKPFQFKTLLAALEECLTICSSEAIG